MSTNEGLALNSCGCWRVLRCLRVTCIDGRRTHPRHTGNEKYMLSCLGVTCVKGRRTCPKHTRMMKRQLRCLRLITSTNKRLNFDTRNKTTNVKIVKTFEDHLCRQMKDSTPNTYRMLKAVNIIGGHLHQWTKDSPSTHSNVKDR